MANYTKLTDFAAKDALSSGNPAKIVKGTEIDDEFNAISTAVQSKSNTNSPTFTGTPAAPTAAAGTNTTQIATTGYVVAERDATATLTNKTLTSPTINTPTMDLSGVTSSGDLSVANGGTGASTAANARTNLGVGTVGTLSYPGTTTTYLRGDGTFQTIGGTITHTSGSAPYYGARAYGIVVSNVLRASGNVSSWSYSNQAFYYSTAMPETYPAAIVNGAAAGNVYWGTSASTYVTVEFRTSNANDFNGTECSFVTFA